MPQGPCLPQIFFGRDSELAKIIDMVFSDLGSPARIAILGPGGYGKSTLANAVLTHKDVQEHFGDARYFVACESVFSSGALLTELGKTLGLLDGATESLWPRIETALDTKDCILCLDNFESPWDQDGDTKYSVEKLLSEITKLRHTTVLITMRGQVRPGQTSWTRDPLPLLKTLDHDAAKSIWEQIANNYDDFAKKLIEAVDCVPLAVTLLSNQAEAVSPELLLKQWNKKHTEFIHVGQENRHLSLDDSIQLSIDSFRIRKDPFAKDLLGIFTMLSDGIYKKQIESLQMILSIDIESCICTLKQCSLIYEEGERYQTHPIIRSFCMNHIIISEEHKNALNDFYINLASTSLDKTMASRHNEMKLEVNNTKGILFDLLKSDFKDHAKLVKAICTFTEFHASIGDYSDRLISQTVEHLQHQYTSTSLLIKCFKSWATLHYLAHDLENTKLKLKRAENLCRDSKENKSSLHASIIASLGIIYLNEGRLNVAEDLIQNALEIHKHIKDIQGQGDDYFDLGRIYLKLNKLNEAKDSFEKAIKIHIVANSVSHLGYAYFGLGNVFLRLNQLNEAKASYQKALKHDEYINDFLS